MEKKFNKYQSFGVSPMIIKKSNTFEVPSLLMKILKAFYGKENFFEMSLFNNLNTTTISKIQKKINRGEEININQMKVYEMDYYLYIYYHLITL